MRVMIILFLGIGLIVLVLGLLVTGSTNASPNVQFCNVPGEYSTIQAAVDDDTCTGIVVGSGAYTETVTIDRSVTIQGQGQEQTYVKPDLYDSVFTIESGATVTMTNMTITNGYAFHGGGIYVDHSTLFLEYTTVANNHAFEAGAGIYNFGGDLVIRNVLLHGNSGSGINGGAIYTKGGGSVFISDSSLIENWVSASSYNGGAIYNYGSTVEIEFSDILSNTSNQRGGAIYNEWGSISISNSTLRANSAGSGGALYNSESMNLTESVFLYNEATYYDGAAVLNSGELLVEDCLFEGNNAPGGEGGAITNYGLLAVEGSTFNKNSSWQDGGAIHNVKYTGFARVHITDSLFQENTSGSGGAITNEGGIITIDVSTFQGNIANSGGAIRNWDSSDGMGIMTISKSALVANSGGFGGAILNAGELTIENSTISGNSANRGGGIGNFHGWLMTSGSTLAYNASNLPGGGILTEHGTTEMVNTIVAANTVGGDCWGEEIYLSLGHNLDSDGSCYLTSAGDITNSDPLLSPLHTYNGSIIYRALSFGSPAIDAGDNASCFTADQRGAPRPYDGDGDGSLLCDIGAIEHNETLPFAHFMASPRLAEPLIPVAFTNLSAGEYSSNLWDFGDDITSTLPSPTHSYPNTGYYTVTLTIHGSLGSDSVASKDFVIIVPEVHMSLIPIIQKP
jgi:PKD repeat protein